MSRLTEAQLYINFAAMVADTPYENPLLSSHFLNTTPDPDEPNVRVDGYVPGVSDGYLQISNAALYDADVYLTVVPTASTVSIFAKVKYPSDFQCIGFVNPSTGNGFALRGVGTLRLHTMTAWGFDSAGALTFGSTTLDDDDEYGLEFNGTQLIAYRNDVDDFTYYLSALEIAAMSGTRPIWAYNADNVAAGGIRALGINYGDAVLINSYPAIVRSGQTGIAYTTTGLSNVSGITIGSLAATSIADVSGDGTHSIPSLVDGVAHELYGTRTVTITGTGGSPTTTASFLPPVGMGYVELSGTIDYSELGLYNMSPIPVVGDYMVKPDTLGMTPQGLWSGETGSYICWHIEASTKIARSFTTTLGPPVGDTTPDPFAFVDATNVALSVPAESNVITVTGINAPAAISVTGGEYAINTGSGFGAYTTASGTIANGNTFRVRHTSSASPSTSVDTVLTIGGVSDTFTTTTLAADTTPDAFSFTDVTNATISTQYTSNTITVSGLNTSASISITGGTYSKNGGAYIGTGGTVVNGDTVSVRVTSSGSYSTAVNAVLTIGTASDTYTVTTEAAVIPDMPPNTTINVVVGSTSVINTGALSGSLPITYTKSGADHALFSINSSSGAVAFLSPATIGTYTVIRTATNSSGADSQILTIQVIEAVADDVISMRAIQIPVKSIQARG